MRSYLKMWRQRLRARGKTNAEIFDAIYSKGGWDFTGVPSENISSGAGSDPATTEGYEALVAKVVEERDCRSILDIGCGDFQVSQRILRKVGRPLKYIGVDASQVVIERNTKLYSSENVSFLCLDATADPLPDADLVLVREVMQHLSDEDIFKMVAAIKGADYNIVTNTVRLRPGARNISIATGSNSRAGLGHGLWLDKPPYNLDVTELGRWQHRGRASPTELVSVRINP